jgi:hypothetical protein
VTPRKHRLDGKYQDELGREEEFRNSHGRLARSALTSIAAEAITYSRA